MQAQARPVRPRDAATLVIHRQRNGTREVLLGRRSDKARFKPGVYVFPGGGLEAHDHRVVPHSPLAADIPARVGVGSALSRAQALALAAVRETFEECGLIVGAPGDIGPNPSPSWQAFRALGLAPPLGALRYLGRAITPAAQPIRFHARFFAVDVHHVSGRTDDTSELSDLQWVPTAEVRDLQVMPVTLLMLEALVRQLDGNDPRAAYLSTRQGKRLIVWS